MCRRQKKVKCADCGFLSLRNNDTRILDEIELESRQNGIILTRIYYHIPVCFAVVADFKNEIIELKKSPEFALEQNDAYGNVIKPRYQDLLKLVFNKERNCNQFTKWRHGFTPKEHQEIIDRKKQRIWRIIEALIFIVAGALFSFIFSLIK